MSDLQDAIAKITKEFESVQRMQKDAEASLAKTREEQRKAEEAFNLATQQHGKLLADLDAKKIAADSAAAEAATRIQMNRDQTAELLRMREDIDRREKVTAKQEASLKQMHTSLANRVLNLASREKSVAEAETQMAARRAKLHEALS